MELGYLRGALAYTFSEILQVTAEDLAVAHLPAYQHAAPQANQHLL